MTQPNDAEQPREKMTVDQLLAMIPVGHTPCCPTCHAEDKPENKLAELLAYSQGMPPEHVRMAFLSTPMGAPTIVIPGTMLAPKVLVLLEEMCLKCRTRWTKHILVKEVTVQMPPGGIPPGPTKNFPFAGPPSHKN